MTTHTTPTKNEQYIIDNYQRMTYKEMGTELGISRGSVQYVMNKYNLKKSRYSVEDFRHRVNNLEDFIADWQSKFEDANTQSYEDVIRMINLFNTESQQILND